MLAISEAEADEAINGIATSSSSTSVEVMTPSLAWSKKHIIIHFHQSLFVYLQSK